MYTEAGLLFPYFHNSSQELHQLEDLYRSHKPNASMSDPVETSISDYDLGGEGDLFKAPVLFDEEPLMDLDPVTAAISMISCGGEVMSPQTLEVAESIQNVQLLNEAIYEFQESLVAKSVIETPVSETLESKLSCSSSNGRQMVGEKLLSEAPFQKSISSECLSSMEWIDGTAMRPNFLDFTGMNFGSVYGMRRAYSEGDIKTLGNGQISLILSPLERRCCNSEERMEKLSRYRNKKKKRNFGRKIKYACRKALADNQPRIRGRFAKTEEPDILKKE